MTYLDEYWNKFIQETHRDPEDRCSGDLNFEAKGFLGDELITLTLTGQKTAFFSSFSTFSIDGEPLPVSGELYIIVDHNNNPHCVIEIESVTVIPFNEVTWEMAAREGEDSNLTEWREKHQEYLEEEGSILGFEFTPAIKLVYQTFKVVYK
ncbi:MAG: ASCH domain-containing protein [Treponema sp.]|nr:ASCH domain-containing protein [Treponema sp.]